MNIYIYIYSNILDARYGIFTYICLRPMVYVGKYSIHSDHGARGYDSWTTYVAN